MPKKTKGPDNPSYSKSRLRELGNQSAIATELARFKQCIVQAPGPCGGELVRGHSVAEARLKVLAIAGKVITLESPEDLKGYGDPNFRRPRPVHPKTATTGFFSCQEHEKAFHFIEQSTLDWAPEVKSLQKICAWFAYRAVLIATIRQESVAKYFELMSVWNSGSKRELRIHPQQITYERAASMCRDLADEAWAVKHRLDRVMELQDYDRLNHRIVHIDAIPSVAASTAILHRAYLVPEESPSSYRIPIPVMINVYPTVNGPQTVIISCLKNQQQFANSVVSALDLRDEDVPASISKTLLEESENIVISPNVWSSFGRLKQQDIARHFEESTLFPTTPGPQRVKSRAPEALNLFAPENQQAGGQPSCPSP